MSKNNQIETRTDNQTKKKKSKRKKVLLYTGIPVLAILITILSYGVHLYTKAERAVEDSYEDVGRDNGTSDLRTEAVDPVEDNVSILIIGVDASVERDNSTTRSDTLMLATFNKKDSNVKLLSIPRDSRVFVPEVGYDTKINHAHSYGGTKASIETVENFLDVPVDYYVELNFKAFIEVVDAIGGINYNVPFDMSEINTKGQENTIKIDKGYQRLDGEKALALARSRKYDSDIKRGERQQEIIKIIADKVTSSSSVLKLDNLIDAIGDNMKTNLNFNDMKSFLSYGMNSDVAIESVNLEGSGGKMVDGLWYYQVDEESRAEISQDLREHLDLPIMHTQEFETEFSAEDENIEGYHAY
ncbi:transcriptional regulator [Virgibacillus profundi]|uniref:Transcriptional regulator n=2 Tax=Virgibacillus profundi TaxID=2024555 RepID=A0A2A2IJK5_9BACI|nr:transcriptional regulator [Virgibacillus profundi]PXY55470.1 transcriptional regulator [Virgibacillus profundi]